MRPLEILFVEDCVGDVLLTSQILAESSIPVRLQVAQNGLEAILMLGHPVVKPDLVILDLNIPEVPGHAVLKRYRPRDVPVVVFSSSSNDADKRQALSLGACDYVQKPMDLEAYRDAVRGMIRDWVRPTGFAATATAAS